MVRVSRIVFVAGVVSATVLAWSPQAWARQTQTQPPVALPRFDVVAGVAFRQIAASAGADRTWLGPGLSLTVDGNVSDHLAITTSVEKDGQPGAAALAGVQLITGFYYGSGRDPVAGRFFTRLMAGAMAAGTDAAHGAGRLDVGADILLSRSRGVGLRWEVGYDVVPGEENRYAYGRAAIGVVFGPRLSAQPSPFPALAVRAWSWPPARR